MNKTGLLTVAVTMFAFSGIALACEEPPCRDANPVPAAHKGVTKGMGSSGGVKATPTGAEKDKSTVLACEEANCNLKGTDTAPTANDTTKLACDNGNCESADTKVAKKAKTGVKKNKVKKRDTIG